MLLKELEDRVNLGASAELLSALEQRQLRTLEDIRRAGGLWHLEGLPEGPEAEEALQKLEAHASLAALSEDARVNQALIEQGFTSPGAIARTPEAHFIAAAKDVGGGELEAAQLSAKARAQTAFLDNVLMGMRAEIADGREPRSASPVLLRALQEEREEQARSGATAVSPVAYLADLIEYARMHLLRSKPIGGNNDEAKWRAYLKLLVDTVHQPFDGLLEYPDAADEQVRQVRICVEVLRSHLKVLAPYENAALEEAEKAYRVEAYRTLLTQLGTSYDELRLSRGESDGARDALVQRLGIGTGHLSNLLLDPDKLTEEDLEEVFGLQATTHDALSTGVKRNDQQERLARWRLYGVEWNRNTDPDGIIYAQVRPEGSADRVELFRDPGRQELVAAESGIGTFDVVEENNSGLTARVSTGGSGDNPNIQISAIPRYLAWRLQDLRRNWETEDYPSGDAGLARRPIIDPDLIGPADFRDGNQLPQPANPPRPIDLWSDRHSQLDEYIDGLDEARRQGARLSDWIYNVPQPTALALDGAGHLYVCRGAPNGGMLKLDTDGTPTGWHISGASLYSPWGVAVDGAGDIYVTDAGSGPSDGRLLKFSGIDGKLLGSWDRPTGHPTAFSQPRNVAVDAAGDVFVADRGNHRVVKLDHEGNYIAESSGQLKYPGGIALDGAGHVFVTDAESRRGVAFKKFDANLNLIEQLRLDGEGRAVDGMGDLYTASNDRILMYSANGQLLRSWGGNGSEEGQLRSPQDIAIDGDVIYVADRGNGRIQAISTEWWDAPSDFKALLLATDRLFTPRQLFDLEFRRDKRLNLPTAPRSAEELGLTDRAFLRLHRLIRIAVRGNTLPNQEWSEVYAIVAQAHKRKRLYPQWVQEEEGWRDDSRGRKLTLGPDYFRIPDAEPAELPAWRATRRDRREWQDTLRTRIEQERAVIDAVRTIVATTEEAALPILRDALASHMHLPTATWGSRGAGAGQFTEPHHVAADDLGHIYVADGNNHRIQKFDAAGRFLEAWGGRGTAEGKFQDPRGVSVDRSGYAYVTDRQNQRVQKFNSEGGFIHTWSGEGTAAGPFKNPNAIAVDGAGSVYVADAGNHRILKFTDTGDQVLAEWGKEGRGDREFSYPNGVAVDGAGHVYVVDHGNHRVQKFSSDGAHLLAKWGGLGGKSGQFRFPLGIAVDSSGHVYVADKDNNRIQKFDADGRLLLAWGRKGSEPGQFDQPFGVAVDRAGNVYVTEAGNHRVQRFAFLSPQELNNRLLIDTMVSGRPATTRAGQAITALQGALWAARTGQLELEDWALDAPQFDEEWKWMGSYATWRAAVLVFLYPQNLLHPTLRRRQTPAFRTLLTQLRTGARLSADKARAAAADYSAYFRDVARLRPEASCEARARIPYEPITGSPTTQDDHRDCFFMFGRSEGKAYWSFSIADDEPPPVADHESSRRHSYWHEVPGLSQGVLKVAGAVPYEVSETERYVLLFAMRRDGATTKLAFCKFDLDLGDWIGNEPETLDGPDDFVRLDCLIDQSAVGRPRVLLSGIKNQIFSCLVGQINADATGWAEQLVPVPVKPPFSYPVALHSLPAHDFVTVFPVERSITADGKWRYKFDAIAYSLVSSKEEDTGNEELQCKEHKRANIVEDSEGWVLSTPHNSGYRIGCIWLKGGICHYGSIEYSSLDHTINVSTLGSSACNIAQMAASSRNPRQPIRIFYQIRLAANRRYIKNLEAVMSFENKTPEGRMLRTPYFPAPDRYFEISDRIAHWDELSRRTRRDFMWQGSADNVQVGKDDGNEKVVADQTIYLEETYYAAPMQMALTLSRLEYGDVALDWLRTVYDYSEAPEYRKVYYGIRREEESDQGSELQREEEWLLDPLDPHAVARARPLSYTRFTLISLVQILLDYADAEFTRDTAESVPRARALYETALALLEGEEFKQRPGAEVDSATRSLSSEWRNSPGARSLNASQGERAAYPMRTQTALLAHSRIAKAARRSAFLAARQGARAAQGTSMITAGSRASFRAEGVRMQPESALAESMAPYLAETPERSTTGDQVTARAFQPERNAAMARSLLTTRAAPTTPGQHLLVGPLQFWFPPNPVPQALRLRAEVNLYKMRNGRNIAGMERQLEPYSAPTDITSGLPTLGVGGQLVLPQTRSFRPTQYRYVALAERAKQLVALAQQIEAAFLSALEKRDAEAYSLLNARRDLDLQQAGVRLQSLRVREAEGSVELAHRQEARAQLQVDHFAELIDEGISALEQGSLALLGDVALLQSVAAGWSFLAAASPASVSVGFPMTGVSVSWSPQGWASSMAAGASSVAASMSTTASILSTMASYERREQEWQFQKSLAQQDVRIAEQQIKLAEDHVRVAGQERAIAEMQVDHAEAISEFLSGKFTNVELYDWMSVVLEGAYSFFLQQATAIAALAENQLAFERQEVPPQYIQADYWQGPAEGGAIAAVDGQAPDRRGLTGSARLLQDIYQLDQYAFETDKRKLQLVKNISLSRMAPVEFERFRGTGMITFGTPMELFDRDFPGHYLRLIKRVRTSVIALIPAVEGIKATLTCTGTSRVILGGDVFREEVVRRDPESVALTSPRDATGLFELQPQSEEQKLFPFEGLGVDTTWEFRMPKAANSFDYNTIADVIITIEYTALNSYDYRQQVIQRLGRDFSADRPFSFRHQFADAWYDLHNPPEDVGDQEIVASFQTGRDDFPPNVDELRIQQVVLYFAKTNGNAGAVEVKRLEFAEEGQQQSVDYGAATAVEGVISTRRDNAAGWSRIIGHTPAGKWKLALPNTREMKLLFSDKEGQQLDDILLVITYAGRTPEWPS